MNKDLVKYIVRGIGWAALIALAYGFVQFERVNYITTYESLLAIFGQHVWIVILSWGIVLVDVAALIKIFTPSLDNQKDPMLIRSLMVIWLTVSTLDITFNWYFAALQMEANTVRVPQAVVEFTWALPIITAMVIWGVQFGLLYTLGQTLDRAINGVKPVQKIKSSPIQKPVQHQKTPTNNKEAIWE